MPVQQKNRAAAEFHLRAQARMEELRTQIADLEKPMTRDQLVAAETELNDLQRRAAILGGFTPDEEIEDQGGDEPLRRAAPEADPEAEQSHRERIADLQKRVVKTFGGLNRYIRAVTGRPEDMTSAQRTLAGEIRKLTRAIIGTTGDASGGEYLLPLQQVQSIFAVKNVQRGIIERARRFPVTGRSLRIPYVKQSDATNTRPMAGFAAVGIIGEGGTLSTREAKFAQRLLEVYKIGALAQIGNETLDDDMTGEVESTLSTLVGDEIMNHFNALCTVDGTGTSQPMGATNTGNPALLKVARKTASQFSTQDIFRMYQQHTLGPNSFWLVTRGGLEQILGLTLGSNTLVSFMPNLVGQPPMTLLGLPLFVSDLPAALGSEGDLALVNPDFYAVAIRSMLTVSSSEHVAFEDDEMTYRWIARAGGIPIPDGTYAYKAPGGTKENPHSPFVVLDDTVAA